MVPERPKSKRSAGVVCVTCLAALLTVPATLQSQSIPTQSLGERVYAAVSGSTFLLEASDEAGNVVATGTGFLVAPNEVVTNAHVANAGVLSIRMNTFSVPCVVTRADVANDLAICEFAGKTNATPIVLATTDPKPGAVVFALGSPRGLENTISQGLFTGVREIDGRAVAQISAPISPGSSGGPVLDAEGRLVGVAVGILPDGQALNFAVPLNVVRGFLAGKPISAGVDSLFAVARSVRQRRDALQYTDLKWKELDRELSATWEQIIRETSDRAVLDQIHYENEWEFDTQLKAARKAIQLTKRPDRELLIRVARALYYITHDAGPSQPLQEAEEAALQAVSLSNGTVAADLQLLANIQHQAGKAELALTNFLKAAGVAKPNSDEAAGIYMSLFRALRSSAKPAEAEGWLKKATAIRDLAAWEWAQYAEFLDGLRRYGDAAVAWMKAAEKEPTDVNVCEAAASYFYADDLDAALPLTRRCVGLASMKNATARLVTAHRLLADMLEERGVYEEAANHARQAISLSPENALAHHALARALLRQRRFTEAISSAKAAIRLSDGKYARMHFTLGNAHFSLEQWPEAVQAFLKAAEQDPTDWAAAYNVAASYYNSDYDSEALRWYREALQRNPNSPRKDQILSMIQRLSKR
jgi:tetratricopeptide (TPR) repeat protein